MRRLIALEHVSLDGVIQAPGGPEEDPSENFRYGGWAAPFFDESLGSALSDRLDTPCDLLLGRKTFEIFEDYWPRHADLWPTSMTATKYVASTTRTESSWHPTIFLEGNVAEAVRELKNSDGPDLNVWGSSGLMQTLMRHDLVDTFFLMIFPVTLGTGKKLFGDGTIPATFHVTEGIVVPNGVVVLTCERAGEVRTGRVGPE